MLINPSMRGAATTSTANSVNLRRHLSACLAALLVVFCCTPIAAGGAWADDASGSAASAATSSESSPKSDAAPAPDDSTSDTDSGDAGSSDTGSSDAGSSDAGSNSAGSNDGRSAESASPDRSDAVTTGTSTSSSSSASASASSSSPSASSESAKPDSDQQAEAQRKSPEDEAAEKRSQANALNDQIARLTAELNVHQAEYDRAKQAHDDAIAQRDATNQQIELESSGLELLRSNLEDYVIDLYKQGGAAPYLDVMLRSTTYKEFLNSWYMANEVPRYAREVIHEKNELINDLRSQSAAFEEQAAQEERNMQAAETKVRQASATRYALVAQAASWNMEAAELVGDDEAASSARQEHDEASAALREIIKQGASGEGVLSGTGYFTHPCPDSTYSSGFGYRSFDNAFHKGLDMAAPEGTPYYAADNGVVVNATNGGGYNGGAGNWVVIDHGNGIVTKYMHSLVTLVEPGDIVVRGQNIGLVGNTGNSFGAHLHFQVEVGGTAVNPLEYL